jgi:hypothetical protein
LQDAASHRPGGRRAPNYLLALVAAALLARPAAAQQLHELPPVFASPDLNPNPSPAGSTFPLDAVPQLASRPAARVKVFLDFNGAPATQWGGYSVPNTPAYDLDGDATTFNDAELNGIREVWSRVSEKYSPFEVNVTTIDPGTYEYNQTVRVVIGGDSTWAGGVYGGYGFVNGFSGVSSNTAFVFPKNLGKGLPKYVAEAAAHEAGHNFGLQHQSAYDPTTGSKLDEYNRGDAAAAPIMGFSYFAARGLWWNGPSLSANTIQDDLKIISNNFFGYRPDDYAGTPDQATPLSAPDGVDIDPVGGVIERNTDADVFKFNTPGGTVNLFANVAPLGPMLDLSLKLTDFAGNTLALADTSSLGEFIALDVPPGDYFVVVASHGNYGDVGQYTLSGTVVPEPAGAAIVTLLTCASLTRRRRARS